MAQRDMVKVAKDDVLAAWIILENLAVSFDQIGAAFASTKAVVNSPQQRRALQEALATYLTPALVQAINEARISLGKYIPDEEAEALAEHIAYWDYASLPKDSSNRA
jgi:hypothetical protein